MHYKRRSTATIHEGEEAVRKSRVIYVLEMGFTLLNKRNKLIISALIRYAAEGIEGSTVNSALSINTYKTKSSYINVSGI